MLSFSFCQHDNFKTFITIEQNPIFGNASTASVLLTLLGFGLNLLAACRIGSKSVLMTLLAKLHHHHHHQLILPANQERALINAVPLFLLLVSPVGAVVEDQLLIEASPFPPISSSFSFFFFR